MTEEQDDKLMRAARQLNQIAHPREDLWPGIAAAIERPVVRRRIPMLAQAAAVVLLVGASSAVTYLAVQDQQTPIVVVHAENVFERLAFTSRYTLGADFVAARNELVAELGGELEKLPLESRATIEANLELLHEAIVATNDALEDEPENTILQGRLLRAYHDELALLQRVSRLSRNVMMRNDI
jgi:hypothetical protein